MNKFVFLDKDGKRFARIVRLGKILATFIILCIAAGLLSFFWIPRFSSPFRIPKKDLIDIISTRKPDVIEVAGNGISVGIFQEQGKTLPDLNALSNFGLGKNFSSNSSILPHYGVEFSAKSNSYFLSKSDDIGKRVILTFDDGPDPTYTPQILEVLKRENVKGVFFIIGEQILRYPAMIKKILSEGHQIGLHTFSHPSEEKNLYQYFPLDMSHEMDFPQKILIATTGVKSRLFRVPYWGAEDTISLNSLVLLTEALDRGYQVFPPNIDSLDWKEKDAANIISNSFNPEGSRIILLHDGGGDRSITVSALPEIIKLYKDSGYEFGVYPSDLISKASLTDLFLSKISLVGYNLKTNFFDIFQPFFLLALSLTAFSLLMMLCGSAVHLATRIFDKSAMTFTPKVSVIIPTLNEERTIGQTLKSLLASYYPNFEIIVANNGSVDKTVTIVKRMIRRLKGRKIRLVNERRVGKFYAINKGMSVSNSEIVIIVDADTQVLPDTIEKIVQPFKNRKVGAVAGNLKVGNVKNLLTSFQAIEYIMSLNLDRRAYNNIGVMTVVPGALGAWRRSIVKKVGGYRGDTLTEDADLTVKIQKLGKKVVFAPNAVAYTEAPETLSLFLRQRLRWTFGMLQVLYKNKKLLFSRKHKALSFILIYQTVLQLPMMIASVFVDLLAIVFIITKSLHPVADYFLFFLVIYTALAGAAFLIAKEKRIWLLFVIPLQRTLYQTLWYYVLYRSIYNAVRGVFLPWQKTDHAGSVDLKS